MGDKNQDVVVRINTRVAFALLCIGLWVVGMHFSEQENRNDKLMSKISDLKSKLSKVESNVDEIESDINDIKANTSKLRRL